MEKIVGKKAILKKMAEDDNGVLFNVETEYTYNQDSPVIVYIDGSQVDHFNSEEDKLRFDKDKTFKGRLARLFSSLTGQGIVGRGNQLLNSSTPAYGAYNDVYDENYQIIKANYKIKNKTDNSDDFAKAILALLETNFKGRKIIVVGKSYGGQIAYKMSYSDIITGSYLINPSIQGSPLADPESLAKLKGPDLINLLSKYLAIRTIQPDKTFTKENAKGIDINNNGKIFVCTGSIEGLRVPKNIAELVMLIGFRSIKKIQEAKGLPIANDGMALQEAKYYLDKKIPIALMSNPYHSNLEDQKYLKTVFHIINLNEKFKNKKNADNNFNQSKANYNYNPLNNPEYMIKVALDNSVEEQKGRSR